MASIKSINPYNNQVLKEFQELNSDQISAKLIVADKAFKNWRSAPLDERKEKMVRCAELLEKNKLEYAKIITLEMGKPLVQSIAEVEKSASACLYYAEHAEQFLADELVTSDATNSFISYEPIGCVLAVMPWNFPFWQVFRFAAPALMAGNVGVLKHASNVPQCSLLIEEIFLEAEFPVGVFQSLMIGSAQIKSIIENPIVKAITLTGSEKAGAEVAMVAGANIKKTVLELGGSDSFIVLKDADLDKAAEVAVNSRMINNGQSCIAAKRFMVDAAIYEQFLHKMKAAMIKLSMGDPMEKEVNVGPLARVDLVEELEKQVNDTIAQGAELYYQKPNTQGRAFYSPAILINVKAGMRAYEEELFGPVATVFKVNSDEEAVRIANDTKFGLGTAIWTSDIKKGVELARRIEVGAVFINGLVKSDPRLPFGGVKSSGYGRELSYVGMREFLNIKTIWVK